MCSFRRKLTIAALILIFAVPALPAETLGTNPRPRTKLNQIDFLIQLELFALIYIN